MATTNGARIQNLEKGQGTLEREVRGLRDDLKTFIVDVQRQISAQNIDLQQKMSAQSRPQWAVLIAAMSFAVMILGGLITLGANGPLRDLSRHDKAIDRISDRLEDISATRFTVGDSRDMSTRFEGLIRDIERRIQRDLLKSVKPAEERLKILERVVELLRANKG